MKNLCTAFAFSLLAANASASTFTVTNTNDSGAGSLRAAITGANNAGSGTVTFSIGSGVQTITPLSALPDVLANVTIDGTTQPGYAGTPLIELNNSLVVPPSGLWCLQSSGTIRALAMNRCSGRAIGVFGGTLTACFIGTDVTGHTALPNAVGVNGLHSGTPIHIGGNTDAEGNLISGNLVDVILSSGQASEFSHNKVGTDVTGEAALGFNGGSAISVENSI